ncbi:MAG: peptidoglycan editing factor PgeF [Balneolaceae bacterium]|nr:MAG: peptidoglycan editing factor PgeF [Balneolaceae bacterium]
MKLYYPQIFSENKCINSCFTFANRDVWNPSNEIQGLNFGLNTSASDAEIRSALDELLLQLGWRWSGLALARQVHGTEIKEVEQDGIYENVDGMITTEPGLILGIQVADCAAVLVADEVAGVAGAFHAGWRGAISGIVPEGIAAMENAGGSIPNFKVYISPCISATQFEVGEEVSSQFPEKFRLENKGKKPRVDLKGYLVDQLKSSGIHESNIEMDPLCTFTETSLYSYRREGIQSGRMLGLIQLQQKNDESE